MQMPQAGFETLTCSLGKKSLRFIKRVFALIG
jgi:hypothetical protein